MENIPEMVRKAGLYCEIFPEVRSWDILGGTISGSSISIEKGFLKTSESSTEYSINIRLFGERGKTGSVNISKMNLPFIRSAIDRTVSLMKGSLPNPEFKFLSQPPSSYPPINTPYDSKVKDVSFDDTKEIIDQFIRLKSRDDRIVSVSGGFSYYDIQYILLNSNGINLENKESTVSLYAEVIMEEILKGKKENSNGYEGQSYIFFDKVNPEEIFNKALHKAQKGLKKSKIPTGYYPVVCAPPVVILLFNRTLSAALDAQTVYERRSFLSNQLGNQIASDNLEILDDPWLQEGLATSAWDMEGTATQPIKLVENGVLKSYLHNVYTANLFETVSTGHASRGLNSISVGISPSNLKILPGKNSLDSMIESIPQGVLIEASYDYPNIVTGEFSGLIASGYLIHDGEIKDALRESLIGINFSEFYNNITGIGKKIHRKGPHYVPYIKVDDVKVSAKE
ncbi:MAG: TldD/PmbA family protein [Candidatus Lokiarchaeota archaeon]|nr:TldD/PmbA family protein [Candidatus Lokiarchaeota archaeon]